MPEFQFQDQQGFAQWCEPGEYMAEVVGFEFGYSTNGNETCTLVVHIEPSGVRIYDTLTFTQAASWKIDTMLKCFLKSKGVDLKKGHVFDLNEEFCEKWLMNARGQVVVTSEEWPVGSGKNRNRVGTYEEALQKFDLGTTARVLTKGQQGAPSPGPVTQHSEDKGNAFTPTRTVDDPADDIPF